MALFRCLRLHFKNLSWNLLIRLIPGYHHMTLNLRIKEQWAMSYAGRPVETSVRCTAKINACRNQCSRRLIVGLSRL